MADALVHSSAPIVTRRRFLPLVRAPSGRPINA